MNQQQSSTKRRILEAAELLYGSEGVQATSLREIVKQAQVNLNAVNYHFGSKHVVTSQLYHEIMAPINQERRDLFDEITKEPPPVRQLFHAVCWPVFRRAVESEQTRRQIIILNQVRQSPSESMKSIVASNIDEIAPQFDALIEQATGLSKKKLFVPIRFFIASMWGLVTQAILIDELAYKKSKRVQMQTYESFLDYALAGFSQLIQEP